MRLVCSHSKVVFLGVVSSPSKNSKRADAQHVRVIFEMVAKKAALERSRNRSDVVGVRGKVRSAEAELALRGHGGDRVLRQRQLCAVAHLDEVVEMLKALRERDAQKGIAMRVLLCVRCCAEPVGDVAALAQVHGEHRLFGREQRGGGRRLQDQDGSSGRRRCRLCGRNGL